MAITSSGWLMIDADSRPTALAVSGWIAVGVLVAMTLVQLAAIVRLHRAAQSQ